MARITSGFLKGLVLTTPRHIRVTEEKVRQALFNILGSQVVGARVIDGFAGSGALGLEALSRGAEFVVFLESHPACLKAIQRNVARMASGAIPGRWEIEPGEALRSLCRLRRAGPFDLIVLDPPYQGDWGKKSLNVVAECGILAPAGILCVEHARRNELPSHVGPLVVMKQHRYGETVLSFYQSRNARSLPRDI